MLIGFVLFPDVTALDAVGPFEILARVSGARTCFAAGTAGPVRGQFGLELGADVSFEECPPLDVVCVPGGPGQGAAMEDDRLRRFLREQARRARWVTSVCTGSLLLGAAGLLRGYRATTHWRYLECLRELGAEPVAERVVTDRNRVTAAGVSAGIDLGLHVAALLAGEEAAAAIRLQTEYDPRTAVPGGSPATADPRLVERARAETQPLFERRLEQCRRIANERVPG